MEEKEFKSEYEIDLKTYTEFTKGFMATEGSKLAKNIIFIIFIASCIATIIWGGNYMLIIGAIAVILLLELMIKIVNKQNLQYNRMTSANKGKQVHYDVTINKDGIYMFQVDTQNKNHFSFDQIIALAETENLLILKMKYKQGIMINKNNLEGGTKEELIGFMFDNCPHIKNKSVKKNKNEIVSTIIYTIILILVLILAIIMAVRGNQDIKRLTEYLESEGYVVENITEQYKETKIESAHKITTVNDNVTAHIYLFEDSESAKYNFDKWTEEEFEKIWWIEDKTEIVKNCYSISDTGVEKYDIGGNVILMINDKYVFYGTYESKHQELVDLCSDLNNLEEKAEEKSIESNNITEESEDINSVEDDNVQEETENVAE